MKRTGVASEGRFKACRGKRRKVTSSAACRWSEELGTPGFECDGTSQPQAAG